MFIFDLLNGRSSRLLRRMMLMIDDGNGADGAAGGGASDGGNDAELSTAERAFELWEKGDSADNVAAKPKDGSGEGDAANQGGEGQGNAEGEGDAEAGKPGQDGENAPLSDEQLQADPRYQELASFRDEMQPVLDKFGVPDTKELGLQLSDAQILYDIASGKGTPSQLLDVMVQNQGWSKDQVAAVAADLKGWLEKQGFLKAGEAAAAGKDGFKDPLAERLDKLENQTKEERAAAQRAEQQRATQERQTKIFKSFTDEIGKLGEKAGVHKEDFDTYGREMRALMPAAGTKEFEAITARIEKGNFVDVKKAFDQVHNRELARLKRYNGSMTAKAERRNNTTPRTPAGGATPAGAAGKPTRDLRSSEGRQAAALEEWNKQ